MWNIRCIKILNYFTLISIWKLLFAGMCLIIHCPIKWPLHFSKHSLHPQTEPETCKIKHYVLYQKPSNTSQHDTNTVAPRRWMTATSQSFTSWCSHAGPQCCEHAIAHVLPPTLFRAWSHCHAPSWAWNFMPTCAETCWLLGAPSGA
jgi:hypothetical protein